MFFLSRGMDLPYASICFYFTDYKFLRQRLVTQGNVLGIDAGRNW